MRYLIDTDWIIFYLKGNKTIVNIMNSFDQDDMAISIISYGEMYEGIYYGRDPKGQEQGFLNFLKGVCVLSLNKSILKEFARIRGDLRSRNLLIGDPDILIAATAIYHDLTLATNNLNHFQRIPNLKLYAK